MDKRKDLKLSSKGMVKKTISKKDPKKLWVTGDKKLRESQAYPGKFAKKIVTLYAKQDASVAGLFKKLFVDMQKVHPTVFEQPRNWEDANLGSLKIFLQSEMLAGRFKPQSDLPFDG